MAPNTIELYVLDLPEEDARTWLGTPFEDVAQVQEEPVAAYEGAYQDASVRVQVTEGVQNGSYTSIWIRASELPWASAVECAEEAHEAFDREVLCHLEDPEHPWRMCQFANGVQEEVDEREVVF